MTYTASLRFEQQLSGSNINTWGDRLDNTLARVDDAIAGFVSLSIAASGDYTVQQATDNASADEARRMHLKLIGSPGANFNLIIPPLSKTYWVWNNTAKVATVTSGSGTTVSIDPGDIVMVWCDGANVKTTTFGGLGLKDFITAQTATAGAVPGTVGALGKFLKVVIDGGAPTWQGLQTTDFQDYAGFFGKVVALSSVL